MRGLGLLCVALVVLCGSLGQPFHRDEVPFESVEREHFDAIAVVRERGPADDAPLRVRVAIVGDATDADLAPAEAWLREHANVVLVRDPRGAPLFLTHGDLSATSGRSTLGATVAEGMAVEATNPKLTNCVVAHEVLHFVGLPHVKDERNMMHPQCTTTRLANAGLTDDQRERLDRVEAIRATTPRGVLTWAERAS
ncbi:MAG TPA: matrixin family metalloprotease [Candidatus Thermoplasmatota archaeon]|nr:matrixin family metalloprotease [Candidatus Thermoplasmatota archaeon]